MMVLKSRQLNNCLAGHLHDSLNSPTKQEVTYGLKAISYEILIDFEYVTRLKFNYINR